MLANLTLANPILANPASLDKTRPFIPVRFAVLTASNTRTLEDDTSGDTLEARINDAGHVMVTRMLQPDDITLIRSTVKSWAESGIADCIITTGGTGFTGHDVTPEALEPLFSKRMEGFSVAFHTLSMGKIGTSTLQSRATAGLIGTTFVFVLPGSPGACRDAWDGILAPQFDYRHKPCNFVEIMPRLDEHLKRGAEQPA
jgi:molybdopterin adenylyltransferase